ncbi:MAG TPA: ABC-2 family transporter protein [Chloroflexaceae bacterium]|nr:ABC-2 family transporter protein [Chloroflexaceae bacterium]
MGLYLAIAVRAFRRATAYRSAYLAGIITNAFFGALVCFVYQALYAAGGTVAGLTLHDAISYAWATQALISVGAGWITSTEISGSIATGDVITDLYRPWSFYLYWLSRSLGERTFNLLFRGALTYLIGVLYFGARVPGPGELLAFAPAIALAMLVSFSFSFVVNLSAFWLLDATGVILMANVLLSFFSGFLLPLAFFPPAIQAIARALPFQAITSLPAQIFLGQIRGPAVAEALALQLFWAVALAALALAVQAVAMRKVVVQGG